MLPQNMKDIFQNKLPICAMHILTFYTVYLKNFLFDMKNCNVAFLIFLISKIIVNGILPAILASIFIIILCLCDIYSIS